MIRRLVFRKYFIKIRENISLKILVCQVLKMGGRFVLVMANGETRWTTVYNQMKTEGRWGKLLENTR